MPKFILRCPLHKDYIYDRNKKICSVTQWFGEKNSMYASGYHDGIDFRTKEIYRWEWDANSGLYRKENRTLVERGGRIPIVASHSGTLTASLSDDKQRDGWGLICTSDIMEENENIVQFKTVYWHIETPWYAKYWTKHIAKALKRSSVNVGAIIAIGGNNGLSTGAHLHFSLSRRTLMNGKWGAWIKINPKPYLNDLKYIK